MRLSELVKIIVTIVIPPHFRVFGNVDILGVFKPTVLNIDGNHLNDIF